MQNVNRHCGRIFVVTIDDGGVGHREVRPWETSPERAISGGRSRGTHCGSRRRRRGHGAAANLMRDRRDNSR